MFLQKAWGIRNAYKHGTPVDVLESASERRGADGIDAIVAPRRGPPGAGQVPRVRPAAVGRGRHWPYGTLPGAAGLLAGSPAEGPGSHRQGAPRCRARQHGLPSRRAVAPRPLS
jgi:hypothetical protein